MITLIDELAGSTGLMFSPVLFREMFLPLYREFFSFVKSQNLYTAILLDGNVTAIIDDIIGMDTDCVQFMEPNEVGIDDIAHSFSGKKCIKTSVDMKTTLATGTPSQVRSEMHRMVRAFHTERGGYIPVILRWHRPSYPEENVHASVTALQQYRKK
jgi:uroporphyrinogen decarboxylase